MGDMRTSMNDLISLKVQIQDHNNQIYSLRESKSEMMMQI